ncbi:DUF1684 domain-containing protein [Herbiconiux sp. L3-i23]|uniref:DUF1684 domain-containing protein n=1 Tax=Herbiconiux sp. L3-i23 TaxID=2905871 RepID=UPI0020614D41|nr:DUF1684 domain-containing protein [Herbiconiux sp. L3-i23]BDI23936.1 hypothetical protein L3i23_27120 [Herbiconiux sp. L3-i23]
MTAVTALQTADWRRRIFALYDTVRVLPPAEGHNLWVSTRNELFAAHPASPLLPEDREGFSGLPVAPYDPAWRFELPIEGAAPERMEVETGTDGVVPFERIGLVRVPEVGSLDVWRLASYGGGVFVPVKDATANTSGGTYGGGRYLIDSIKGSLLDGEHTSGGRATLTLDFNFAYNPSCAYDPAWACPLAPLGNTVAAPIPVGERYGS